jgi:two-component system nitrogen regulation sensor histidine kinase NtrY
VLLVWITGNQILDHYHYGAGYHKKLQNQLVRKYGQIDRYHDQVRNSGWDLNTNIPADKGILILAYEGDSLIYWSDNSIAFATFNQTKQQHNRFEFLSNGWYVIREYQDDTVRSYGLYLVKSEYPYENDFLKNEFQADLKLPKSTELLTEPAEGTFSILDWEGMYLFSVHFNGEEIRFEKLE